MAQIIQHVIEPFSTIAFDCPPSIDTYRGPLKMLTSCYRPSISDDAKLDPNAFTLILIHGLGQHKETWEPPLHEIFERQRSAGSPYRIREAWAFDWQCAGDSAALNTDSLIGHPPLSHDDYSNSIISFMKTHIIHHDDGNEQLPPRRFCGISYSGGGHVLMHVASQGGILFDCAILVEPVMSGHDGYLANREEYEERVSFLNRIVPSQQRDWANKEEAAKWLKRVPPFKSWEPTAMGIFLAHGLRKVTTKESQLENDRKPGNITFSFDKRWEGSHLYYSEYVKDGMTLLEELVSSSGIQQIHAIFGEENDFIPISAVNMGIPQRLLTQETVIKVSSTLDKSVGRKHLIDQNPDTCWTSQQGLPQHIQFTFGQPVRPTTISITFQGGFVGTRCTIKVQKPSQNKFMDLTSIYPEDVNRVQTFELPQLNAKDDDDDDGEDDDDGGLIEAMRIVFEESSDFFGRITVYNVDVQGHVQ